jgi:hypothetical protein
MLLNGGEAIYTVVVGKRLVVTSQQAGCNIQTECFEGQRTQVGVKSGDGPGGVGRPLPNSLISSFLPKKAIYGEYHEMA